MIKQKFAKENGFILYGTFLPIIIIAAIVIGAGYFLLGDDIKLPKFGRDKTEVRRFEDYPTVVYTKQTVEKQRRIITNQQELEDFLSTVSPEGELLAPQDINFDKEFVIGVATDSDEVTQRELKVKKIYENKDKKELLISLREREPNDDCNIDLQNNIAVDLVAISKTDWKIEFERVKEEIPCENEDNTQSEETTNNTETSEEQTQQDTQ